MSSIQYGMDSGEVSYGHFNTFFRQQNELKSIQHHSTRPQPLILMNGLNYKLFQALLQPTGDERYSKDRFFLGGFFCACGFLPNAQFPSHTHRSNWTANSKLPVGINLFVCLIDLQPVCGALSPAQCMLGWTLMLLNIKSKFRKLAKGLITKCHLLEYMYVFVMSKRGVILTCVIIVWKETCCSGMCCQAVTMSLFFQVSCQTAVTC